MLARLVSGWPGKILVLVLLGFAATGFVITKTLSAADAAVHLIENPNWPWKPAEGEHPTGQQIAVTMLLLVLLGAMFLRGFREVIGLAVGDRRRLPGAERGRHRVRADVPGRAPGEVVATGSAGWRPGSGTCRTTRSGRSAGWGR